MPLPYRYRRGKDNLGTHDFVVDALKLHLIIIITIIPMTIGFTITIICHVSPFFLLRPYSWGLRNYSAGYQDNKFSADSAAG